MIADPLAYVNSGWALLPIHSIQHGHCTCGKDPCRNAGKHPMTLRGVNDASTDPTVIQSWVDAFPRCNWAVACGAVSNLVVIDVDPRHSGDASLEVYEQRRGKLPTTLRQRTGGGGWHLMYQYPHDGLPLINQNRGQWLQGVDVKSDGGYVLIPPSNHASGGAYVWLDAFEPVDLPPDILADLRSAVSRGNTRGDLPSTPSILAGVPEGERDDVIFKAACRWRRIHQKDPDGGRAAVTTLVLTAARNSVPPFPDDEALAKVEQAFKQDHQDDLWPIDGHRLTDDGNAIRLVDRFGENLRYVGAWGWLHWNGTKWARGAEDHVEWLARLTTYAIRDEEATATPDPDRREALLKWAHKSESRDKLNAMARVARSDPRVVRPVDLFDSDPLLLGCVNGVVDLRNGQLLSHDPKLHITRSTDVIYDPEVDTTYWEQFLDQACDSDPELIRYMRIAAGYTLTGSTDADAMFIIYGPQASGKSTFMDALNAALGGYAVVTQAETLMMKWGGQSTPRDELARFAGARLVSSTEVPEGERFSEALVKQLTGGDAVAARHLYRDAFEYRPSFKLWLATNHAPVIRDEAIWRRIKRIPFPNSVPKEHQIPGLRRWVRDRDGGARMVLAWAVRGAMEWIAEGKLVEPAAVVMETDDYRHEQDRFGQFIEETCIVRPDAAVTFASLWARYRSYCDTLGERPMQHTAFKIKLRERGYAAARLPIGPGYSGLELKAVSTYGI